MWPHGQQSQTATSYSFEDAGDGPPPKDAVPLTKNNCERLGIVYEEGFAREGNGIAKRRADDVSLLSLPKRVRLDSHVENKP